MLQRLRMNLRRQCETITPVYEAALKAAPDYDEAAIYETLKNSQSKITGVKQIPLL